MLGFNLSLARYFWSIPICLLAFFGSAHAESIFHPPFENVAPKDIIKDKIIDKDTEGIAKQKVVDSLTWTTNGNNYLVVLVRQFKCEEGGEPEEDLTYGCEDPQWIGVFKSENSKMEKIFTTETCGRSAGSEAKVQLYDVLLLPDAMRMRHRDNQVMVLNSTTTMFGYQCLVGAKGNYEDSISFYGMIDGFVKKVFEHSLGEGERDGDWSEIKLRLIENKNGFNDIEAVETKHAGDSEPKITKELFKYDGRQFLLEGDSSKEHHEE